MMLLPTLLLALACGESAPGEPTPPNLAPAVTITLPASGLVIAEGDTVILVGSATDPEDGVLGDPALAWFSSLDGRLGDGDSLIVATLAPGTHTISLEATDSRGARSTATVQVTVTTTAVSYGLLLISDDLTEPVFLTSAPGDATRLFVVEKTGRIRILKNGNLLATPFLNLHDSVSTGSEQGLLGLAFAPDYETSGRFFVSYTSPRGSLSGGTSVIAEYRVSTGNPDMANPQSGRTVLRLDQPYSNHNGGMIAFGPDGYLYVGFGDGGGGGDPVGTGQDPSDLLGSILRLDVSGDSGYAIPPTNPFATSTTNAPELWNYGLRNPWRFSFDRATGDLFIADVGQGNWEEVNAVPAGSTGGENFGWNQMEGFVCFTQGCSAQGRVLPVIAYDHGNGCSVTGGYVYRGSAVSALQGHYLYGDYCGGWVRSFRLEGGQAVDAQDRPTLSPGGLLTSFGEDLAGEVYVLTQGGSVYRIVPR
jgi:glucose/arabinose dehydrogenase